MYKIFDDRFHSIIINKRYIKEFKKDEVTIANLLAICLSLSNKKYKTIEEFSKFLEGNYNMQPGVKIVNLGDYMSLSFTMNAMNPKYSLDDNYNLDKILSTFNLIINEPNVWNKRFKLNMFNYAKKELKTAILHYNDDRGFYATKRALSLFLKMDFSELFGECIIDELDKITPNTLYDYYLDFKSKNEVSYIDGDIDRDFTNDNNVCFAKYMKHRKRIENYEELIENDEIDQAYIRLIYENAPFYDEKDAIAASLATFILGGDSTSKLFLNVREKKGLCYDIYSAYYANFGFVLVSLGTDVKNIDIAIAAIEEEIASIKQENITTAEFNSLKNKLINSLRETCDYQTTKLKEQIINDLFMDKNLSIDDRIKIIEELSINDVIKAAKKLKLAFKYVARGDKSE